MSEELAKLKVVIEASTADYKKSMDKAKQIAHDTMTSVKNSTDKMQNPFVNIRKKLKNAKKDFQIKAGIKVPTEELKQVEADIQKTEATLNGYYERRDKAEALGVSKESRAWKSLEYDIKNAEAALKRYNSQKEAMQNNGTDIRRPVSIPRQMFNFSKSVIGGAGKALGGLGGLTARGIQKGWGGTLKMFGKIKTVLSGVSKVIKRTSGLFGALIKKFASGIPVLRRTRSSFNGLGTSGKGLSGILKTIGMTAKFMFASFVIRGAVDGAKEGFKNLAQYSARTNASISLLMSSLAQLKNALAAAFAPILNVVTPILNSLIQKIISVVNAFGQLTGALTGSTTYIRAKKVNQDYAASLKDNTSNAKKAKKANEELQKTILGFDQINKMDDNKSNDSGDSASDIGGLSPGDMFETVSIDSKFKNLAQQIKDAWNNADFTEIGSIVGRKLNTALSNIPWSEIKNTASRIAKSIATLLNGFIESTDWGLVGNTLAQGINTAFGFANTFAENFHWGSLGDAIGNGINGALNGIDWELIRSTAFNWGAGIAQTLNQAISTIDWSLVGVTISNGINAAFLFTQAFATTFNWDGLGIAVGNGINGALSTLDWNLIRSTVSNVTAGIVNTLNSFITTADWGLAGYSFGQGVNTIIDFAYEAVHNFNWKQLGISVSNFLNKAVSTIDFAKSGKAISDAIKGLLDFFIQAVENTDWKQVGEKVKEFLVNIDWNGIVDRLFEVIGAAFGGFGAFIGGLIGDAVQSAKNYFQGKIEECGGNVVQGILKGIGDAILGIGSWIKEHIFQPFIDGFKSVFGIHSPSTVMEEMGGFLMEGLLGGIKVLVEDVVSVFTGIRDSIGEVWSNITDAASAAWEGITTTVGDTWEDLKTTASETFSNIKDSVTGTWDEVKKNASTMWKNITGTIGDFWDNLTTSADTKFEDIEGSVSRVWNSVKETSGNIWGSVKETVGGIWGWLTGKSEKDFPEIQKDAEDAFGAVNDTTVLNWGNSSREVELNLRAMKLAAAKELGNMTETVRSYSQSMYNIITDKFKWAGQKACMEIESWSGSFSTSIDNAISVFNGFGYRIAQSIGDLYNIGRNAAQSFANGMSSVHIPTPHISVDSSTWRNGNGYSYRMNSSVRWYGNGGFPNNGEMFIANENGPELIGRMGRKNAVANNNQIVEGIKAGVFEAVMDAFDASDAFRQDDSDKGVVVEFTFVADSETVYKFVRKGEKKYNDRYFITETV